MTVKPDGGEYILGHSTGELQRLIVRAQILRRSTESLLTDAGVDKGMRVLDLGCGPGDVAFLLSERVGRNGSVMAIDRAPIAIETAQRRAQERGITNVSFVCSSIEELDYAGQFDAVVGRLVLPHQPDPVLTVRQAAEQARPGGLVIFQELALSLSASNTWPEAPLYERCVALSVEAQRRCGVHYDAGVQAHQIFKAAGLPAPEMRFDREIGPKWNSAMAVVVAALVRSLLPKIEEFGLATAREIEIDTLTERLQAEMASNDAITMGTPMVGAWARKPVVPPCG